MEAVQYIGGCSVHRGDNISTMGDSFSNVRGYNISTCREITSVLWGIHQYYGGYSVLWRDTFSTVRGITAAHVGDSFSTVGIPSVLWRLFSTLGDKISTVGDNISTVEGIQYIGGITSV